MLKISARQLDVLTDRFGDLHPVPGAVRERLLRLDTPWTASLDPARRAKRVDQVIGWACGRGLHSVEALLCYGALALTFGPAFHHSPGVARVLGDDRDPNIAAPRLARGLNGADWALIRRRTDDQGQWTGEEDWRA